MAACQASRPRSVIIARWRSRCVGGPCSPLGTAVERAGRNDDGLALAVPLAAATGRRDVGLWFRKLGLLLTPEERLLPPVLARAEALHRAQAGTPREAAVDRLLHDPVLLAVHRVMLPLPRRPRLDPLDPALLLGHAKLAEAETIGEAWAAMSAAEQMACLNDAAALERMVALSKSHMQAL